MADNVTLSAGTADGAVVATDDIAGVHYQINKLAHGALDSATLVSTASGLPVQQQGTWNVTVNAAIAAGDNNIGNVDVVTLPAITLAAAQTLATVTTVSTVTAVTDITNPVVVNGGAGQTADIKVTLDSETVAIASIAAGDNNIGNVDIASIAAGDNNIGNVDIASIAAGANLVGDVGIQGRATGGTSTFRSIDLDETEEEVKATAGTIYSIVAFNTTAAPLYLKLYNLTAANTTVGSSTPTHTYMVPGNGDSDGAGFVVNVPQGIAFSTAISAAVTTAVADSDTGAPGANACIVDIQYV